MIEYIHELRQAKVLYILAMIGLAMTLDFISGVLAARYTRTFTSKQGINGLIRKMASLCLLLFFLPLALVIPMKVGIGMLYMFYSGYLWFELHSILENYQKLGIDTQLFQQFITQLKQLFIDYIKRK
ncbi:phage holin family protein [uncultured Enterococcus sp.]|uniref:phage holin family protein n=1 Tax=uncultured Enterococcus sp. TaxID=167972 RepID=UPI0025DDB0A3|nr:phage holin family protein [uncultured Enterococcus sp.]